MRETISHRKILQHALNYIRRNLAEIENNLKHILKSQIRTKPVLNNALLSKQNER